MEKFRLTNLLIVVGAILLSMWCSCLTAQAKAKTVNQVNAQSEDEKVLRTQANAYIKAFANGDFRTIANMWAPDGTLIDIDGQVIQGRTNIEKYFRSDFEQFGGYPLEIAIDSLKFPGDNIAISEGHSRVLDGPLIDVMNHYMVVYEKKDNQWQMYKVIETPCPDALEGSLQDWEWLIGNWSAKPSADRTINVKASWVPGHKFIRCLFEKESSINGKDFAMVIIGRDPINGQIVSWHFDPSGGFGSGKWIKDGQTWIERTKSVEANGTAGSALYTLHKLDDNTFTWRSTQRYLGDSQLPDSDEVTISREQSVGE